MSADRYVFICNRLLEGTYCRGRTLLGCAHLILLCSLVSLTSPGHHQEARHSMGTVLEKERKDLVSTFASASGTVGQQSTNGSVCMDGALCGPAQKD